MTIKTDKKTGAQWREPPYSREEEREINRTINSAPTVFRSHLQSGPYTHPYADLVSPKPEDLIVLSYCAVYKDGIIPKFVYKEDGSYKYYTKEEAEEALRLFLATNPEFTDGSVFGFDHEYTPEGRERQNERIALVDKLMAADAAK